MMEDSLLFEKKQKVMFIFLAQKKGTKRTSTLTHPLPIWRGSNSELQKPTVLSAFWYRGTTRWVIYVFFIKNRLQPIPADAPTRSLSAIRLLPSREGVSVFKAAAT